MRRKALKRISQRLFDSISRLSRVKFRSILSDRVDYLSLFLFHLYSFVGSRRIRILKRAR